MNKEKKKMLSAQYVMSERPAGAFRIVHRPSGKSFVGVSPDLNAAWNSQRFQLTMGVHRNSKLQKDWSEYGLDAFEYEIMERFKRPEDGRYNLKKELERMETAWFERLSPYGEKGYHDRKSEN